MEGGRGGGGGEGSTDPILPTPLRRSSLFEYVLK